jgi:hypothetical protein
MDVHLLWTRKWTNFMLDPGVNPVPDPTRIQKVMYPTGSGSTLRPDCFYVHGNGVRMRTSAWEWEEEHLQHVPQAVWLDWLGEGGGEEGPDRRKIRLIESNAKCRFSKKIYLERNIAEGVLSVRAPSPPMTPYSPPPPLHTVGTCIQYTYLFIQAEGGGRELINQREG